MNPVQSRRYHPIIPCESSTLWSSVNHNASRLPSPKHGMHLVLKASPRHGNVEHRKVWCLEIIPWSLGSCNIGMMDDSPESGVLHKMSTHLCTVCYSTLAARGWVRVDNSGICDFTGWSLSLLVAGDPMAPLDKHTQIGGAKRTTTFWDSASRV